VPFLRVIRDKRGYETTYLMHWFREGSRQQSRIIYVFRTPGGVRVGRLALEPDVLRQIEASHPEIDFDWSTVLDNRQVIDSTPEVRHLRRRRHDEPSGATPPRRSTPPPAVQTAAASKPRFVVPAKVEGETPDAQIAFLATWYVSIREQIEQRGTDPSRREALLSLCERLNPANWTDADQITAGLPPAAEALERLSHVFAKRRRRARKAKPRTGTPAPAGTDDPPPDRTGEVEPDRTDEEPDRADTYSTHRDDLDRTSE
jgi:hypothetical protein